VQHPGTGQGQAARTLRVEARGPFKNQYWSKVHDVVVSPDGLQMVFAADGKIKGEPRFLCNGKVIDGTRGKELHKFNPGVCTFVPRDGKALVRVTNKQEGKTMVVEVWSLDTDK
jgi:hypothetical protein